jgi:glyoxylase-like metal-dependent hydrolase (beta-lactamase superfamily II)
MAERHDLNAPGDWYVDTSCMNCGAARTAAPELFAEAGGQSVFAKQPQSPQERLAAWRIRLLCPTASVHSESEQKPPADAFPEPLTDGVYRLGYNAKQSFGAHSFLIRRAAGNMMVDAPRWTRQVADRLAEWGGLTDILLSHQDDVADAGRYAEEFSARVWIHEADRAAAPYATDLITGTEPRAITQDLLAIPLPGHTKGSVGYLFEGHCLFTGDSLSWSFVEQDLRASRDYCWYSWTAQLEALESLLGAGFDWIFAGHGGSKHLPVEEMRRRLKAMLERYRRVK